MGIYELLQGNDDIDLTVGGAEVTLRRTARGEWMVYLHPDLSYVGKFTEEHRGRATYYVSEIPTDPGEAEWGSDDIITLISRMLTLRE